MSATASRHDWLRRLSDYHSGVADESERAAVEEHLATCAECQSALALYRRFYDLARMPSRLMPADAHDGDHDRPSRPASERAFTSRRSSMTPRQRSFSAIAAAAAAVLVVTGVLALLTTRLAPRGTQAGPTPTARATAARGTPTLTPARDPKDNGWTQVTPAAGDLKFSASSPQRGYLCGPDQNLHVIFGVTTDGGQTWEFGPSPAVNQNCTLQVSPANPLDVVLNSMVGTCGPCPAFDTHYSTDGGKTWKAAPIPANYFRLGGGLWSGTYLYAWAGATENSPQKGFLEVSANGGPFTSLDVASLLPGAQQVNIASAIASDTALYLNLTYDGCSSQPCLAIVASGDGGKTWTQVPNQSNIQLMGVVENTLYGQVMGDTTATAATPTPTTIALSHDGGVSWTTRTLPPQPGGETLAADTPGAWLVTPDGTIFTAAYGVGVLYLRGSAWTVVPFSSEASLDSVVAVSLGGRGQPQRIWGLVGAQASARGIYWHAFP